MLSILRIEAWVKQFPISMQYPGQEIFGESALIERDSARVDPKQISEATLVWRKYCEMLRKATRRKSQQSRGKDLFWFLPQIWEKVGRNWAEILFWPSP